jgi:tellurite resistance protein
MSTMTRDAVLDAIVMVVASDGEVTAREMQLAHTAARDLPSLASLGADLERALGEAFERFVDEGSAARLTAMEGASSDARIEVLLAAIVAAAVDGAPTDDEIACVRRIAASLGATDAEVATVLARVTPPS